MSRWDHRAVIYGPWGIFTEIIGQISYFPCMGSVEPDMLVSRGRDDMITPANGFADVFAKCVAINESGSRVLVVEDQNDTKSQS